MAELKLKYYLPCNSNEHPVDKEAECCMSDISDFYAKYAFPIETKQAVITYTDEDVPVSVIAKNDLDPKCVDNFAPEVKRLLARVMLHIVRRAANDNDARLELIMSTFSRWGDKYGQGMKITCVSTGGVIGKRVETIYVLPELTEHGMDSDDHNDPENCTCFLG